VNEKQKTKQRAHSKKCHTKTRGQEDHTIIRRRLDTRCFYSRYAFRWLTLPCHHQLPRKTTNHTSRTCLTPPMLPSDWSNVVV